MPSKDRVGLLLVNLGTPEGPGAREVRTYLREFLSDPRVLDIPSWQRFLLLNLIILPLRPRRSGAAYEKIWTPEGSPLLVFSRQLATKVKARLGEAGDVEIAMRYGQPSIGRGLDALRRRGADRIVVFPLYPQYSSAATGSSIQKVFEEAGRLWNTPYLQVVPPFYDHPAFIGACASAARPILDEANPEAVLFSFHGLPERHCQKSDETGAHCLKRADCCDRIGPANRNCYRAQCFETARRLADALGVPEASRVICFQSRLGRTPWIRPYTDELLADLPRRGIQRAVILSPAFVADCLETLEELGIRGVETFRAAGGERLDLVPAVNAGDAWADGVVTIAREASTWLRESVREATS